MDRRTKFRQNLHPLYLPLYDQLCENLKAPWQPYQGFRSFPAQEALYEIGRTTGHLGSIVTSARGGESAHCYGCASDWTPFTEDGFPIWMLKTDERWKEYLNVIGSIPGLKKGADFGDVDHNELKINCSWKDIFKEYTHSGIAGALCLIKIHSGLSDLKS